MQPKPEAINQDKRVFVDNGQRSLIESITEKASKESLKEGVNQSELQKFTNFYLKKIKKDGWNGNFDFDTLFSRWMERAWNKAS